MCMIQITIQLHQWDVRCHHTPLACTCTSTATPLLRCECHIDCSNRSQACVFIQTRNAGAQQSLFLATVREDQKVQDAGGLEHDGERIELLALPLDSVEAFLIDSEVAKTTGAMFGLLWAKKQVLGK
jgi:hypothetical protein